MPNRIVETGYVYLALMKVRKEKRYKTGKADIVGARTRKIAVSLPEELGLVHAIVTNDAYGASASHAPGTMAFFWGWLPYPRGERVLLARSRSLHVLAHALSQDLRRGLAGGATRIHKGPTELALHAHPQARILGFDRRCSSLSLDTLCVSRLLDR